MPLQGIMQWMQSSIFDRTYHVSMCISYFQHMHICKEWTKTKQQRAFTGSDESVCVESFVHKCVYISCHCILMYEIKS